MKKDFFKMVLLTTMMTQIFASDYGDDLEQSISTQYGIAGLPSELVFKLIENDMSADFLKQFKNADDFHAVFADSSLLPADLAVISRILFSHSEASAPASSWARRDNRRPTGHAVPQLPESVAKKIKT